MSAWLQRSRQRTAALGMLLGSSIAATGCLSDAPQSRPPEELAADTVAPVPAPAGAPADTGFPPAPDSTIPDTVNLATPMPRPVQAAPDRPRSSSQALQERIAQRGVARVVQGLAQLDLRPQLVPADYLRVELVGPNSFQQEALTSSSGEFFFKDVPAAGYSMYFYTLDKEPRVVHRVPQLAIGPGELVRIGPFRIPIDAVKARK